MRFPGLPLICLWDWGRGERPLTKQPLAPSPKSLNHHAASFSTFTAQALYSGILATGS